MRGEEAGRGEGGGETRQERPEHRVPGVRLELARFQLGILEGPWVGTQRPGEVGAHALRGEASLRTEAWAHRHQPPVGREGDQSLLMLRALLLGAEEGGEQPQIRGHARGPVVPGFLGRLRGRGPGVALGEREAAQLFAERGSHAERRYGLRGDGPVHVDEPTDGEKAPRSYTRQGENQEGRRDEDLVGETHRAIPKLAQGPQSVTTLTPGNPLTCPN